MKRTRRDRKIIREMTGLMEEKKYLLDGEPVSGRELIRAAEALDERFANDWLKQTSVAARILRDNGSTVEGSHD